MSSVNEHRVLAGLGLALATLGLIFNPWTAAKLFTGDGTLETSSRAAIAVFDGILVLAGGGIVLLRRRLATLWEAVDRWLPVLFWLGVGWRVLVFLFLGPENNDPHLGYLRFLLEHGRVPLGGEIYISFHPPLYYLIATPILWITGSLKAVQGLSLILSLVNLRLIYGWIRSTSFLRTAGGRVHAMLLVALLPQFVLFSGFLSNDGLAYLLGTWTLLAGLRWIERPTRRNLVLLGLAVGLGVAVKWSLICYAPLVGVLIVAVLLRREVGTRELLASLALYGVLVTLLGGYKFAENLWHLGTPLPTNDDIPQGQWLEDQQPTVVGLSSFVDVNVAKLVRDPYVGETSRYSIPLLFYGTFWYAHIDESNFDATRSGALRVIPRAIYGLAVLPTLLMALGLLGHLWGLRGLLAFRAWNETDFARRAGEALFLLAWIGVLALVLRHGTNYDAWSFFQARLLFIAFPTMALCLAWGYETLARGRAALGHVLTFGLLATHGVLVTWLLIEIGAELLGR